MLSEQEKWDYLIKLDEELLVGGVILSEWCSFIVCEADTAFAKGANLAAILTAVSGIETYLRFEYGQGSREHLANLIDKASIERELQDDLHKLRKYRNKWVHVSDPWDDEPLLEHPEQYEQQLEEMALFAVKALRRTIYSDQWV